MSKVCICFVMFVFISHQSPFPVWVTLLLVFGLGGIVVVCVVLVGGVVVVVDGGGGGGGAASSLCRPKHYTKAQGVRNLRSPGLPCHPRVRSRAVLLPFA